MQVKGWQFSGKLRIGKADYLELWQSYIHCSEWWCFWRYIGAWTQLLSKVYLLNLILTNKNTLLLLTFLIPSKMKGNWLSFHKIPLICLHLYRLMVWKSLNFEKETSFHLCFGSRDGFSRMSKLSQIFYWQTFAFKTKKVLRTLQSSSLKMMHSLLMMVLPKRILQLYSLHSNEC